MTAPVARWIAPTSFQACADIASLWDVSDGGKVYRVTERRSRRQGEADVFVMECNCGQSGCGHLFAARRARPDPDRHPPRVA